MRALTVAFYYIIINTFLKFIAIILHQCQKETEKVSSYLKIFHKILSAVHENGMIDIFITNAMVVKKYILVQKCVAVVTTQHLIWKNHQFTSLFLKQRHVLVYF